MSTQATGTRFGVLGTLEVHGPAGPVAVPAPRQRVVLAMLLLEPGQVVPVDRLIDAVWDDAPPATARAQVQICVSALRRRLADGGLPGTIVTRAPGYFAQVGAATHDLAAFDDAVRRARFAATQRRPSEAAGLYGTALALWRDEPLLGVPSRLVRSAAERLAERRFAVVEEHVAVLLELGQAARLAGELGELVEAHPFRERVRSLHMLALAQSGRRAEALASYQRARQLFVEQLGLEPGEELRRAERAVLAATPSRPAESTPPPAPPDGGRAARLLPLAAADFAGREGLAARAERLLTGPGMPIVALTGIAGAGKSALAVHLGHRLAPVFPDGQLYAGLAGTTAEPRAATAVLGRFLAALGVPDAELPAGADARAALYRDRLAGRRILVVLDDASGEGQLLPLLPGGPSAAVLVTSRQRLTALPGVHHLPLAPLPVADAVRLVSTVLGDERPRSEPDAVRHLVELCDRLPLAVRAAAARLAARPDWRIATLVAQLRRPGRLLAALSHAHLDVTEAFASMYRPLGPAAQHLFRRLPLVGGPVPIGPMCAALLGSTADEADSAVAELVTAGLVTAHWAEPAPRLELTGLLRAYAADRLAADDRPADHRATLLRLDAARQAARSWHAPRWASAAVPG
ncbi:AfsR/SARP family transcriptional regulator [Amycolatopsis magusensis]|uniref:DNA-binding SARP family transcriptional activator n=1 Tax=Amycolatopsis magusensis TaxID=882444 RepID=A0ABS4PXP5_9PSEU|nr:BTAD domain-containing putative transcriptional regulator [Amycolatopsis magusensis]MBP2184206.1 DNA-binding SARP family transcriptional activator [Amycolatopsis magusensis]